MDCPDAIQEEPGSRDGRFEEDESGLRTVIIPGDLVSSFLYHAKDNSDDGIETLGILGGRLGIDNKFRVTHLLLPRQTGHTDSCTMTGVEELLDIHDKENIILLGWIHTHPAYSVFLSSVDMHNQYERQRLLPEVNPLKFLPDHFIIYLITKVIATVCSIKDGITGHLRLTEDGMKEIGNCSLTNFHPHSSQPPLWTEAEHVDIDIGAQTIIKDLRHR